MTRYVGSDEFRGAEFVNLDMSRSSFREVDLSGARMYGVLLTDADIDGDVRGLRLNGVDVAPLIEAELDRLHPERTKLRPGSPDGMREAWATVESFWAGTLQRARRLPEDDLYRSVNDEWSFTETLRHLVFVIDSWFGHAVLGRPRPYHPLGLPPMFITDAHTYGVDVAATPTLEEVVAVRAERVAQVREFLAAATQNDLDRLRGPNEALGYPASAARTATSCLHVIFSEEWEHHRFAVRDLGIIENSHPPARRPRAARPHPAA